MSNHTNREETRRQLRLLCLKHSSKEGFALGLFLTDAMALFDQQLAKERELEKQVLERLEIEFKAVRCDECGTPWTPCDAHDIVKQRLAQLSTQKKGDK